MTPRLRPETKIPNEIITSEPVNGDFPPPPNEENPFGNFPNVISQDSHRGQSDSDDNNRVIENEISSDSKDSVTSNHYNMFKRPISKRQIKSTRKPDFEYDFSLFNYRKMSEKFNPITT